MSQIRKTAGEWTAQPMSPGMPVIARIFRHTKYLVIDAALLLLPNLHRWLSASPSRAGSDFMSRRIVIASAICLRENGLASLDETAPEVDQWLELKKVPYRKKLLMIQAGIAVEDARQAHRDGYDTDALHVMISLSHRSLPKG